MYPEARAALSAARRAGRVDGDTFPAALSELERLWNEIEDIALTPDIAARAGDLADDLALRGGDAVHLATAEAVVDWEDVLACTDAPLANGARTLGLAVAGSPQSSAG